MKARHPELHRYIAVEGCVRVKGTPMWWVYILKCSDNSFYTGISDDVERRVSQHQAGETKGYTSARRPVTLVFARDFPTHDKAFRWERQIKGWSRRKKQAVIDGGVRVVARAVEEPDRHGYP